MRSRRLAVVRSRCFVLLGSFGHLTAFYFVSTCRYICSDTYCDGGRVDGDGSTHSCPRVRVFALAGWLAFAAPTTREVAVTQ